MCRQKKSKLQICVIISCWRVSTQVDVSKWGLILYLRYYHTILLPRQKIFYHICIIIFYFVVASVLWNPLILTTSYMYTYVFIIYKQIRIYCPQTVERKHHDILRRWRLWFFCELCILWKAVSRVVTLNPRNDDSVVLYVKYECRSVSSTSRLEQFFSCKQNFGEATSYFSKWFYLTVQYLSTRKVAATPW